VGTIIETDGKAFLTLDEAAAIARFSKVTLRRAIAAKRLSACKPNGKFGKTLVRIQDLSRYLQGSRLLAVGETQ
jgi:excisionase family DNA binding protein